MQKNEKQTPISGISSMATRQVLAELATLYQQQTGQPVDIISVGGVDAARRVEEGEAFDVVVLAAGAMDRLSKAGCLDPQSRVGVARSGVAIAVPAGAPCPDIGSEAAVKEAVLAARRIGYSTGPSGTHLVNLFQRWGIAETIAERIVQPPPGVPVGKLVAEGEIDLGFQQLSELMHMPGIQVIGPLPAEIQVVTVFSGALGTSATQPGPAREFLAFLVTDEAAVVKRRHGMEPV